MLLIVLAALWLFPIAAFKNPGTNDALYLADLQLPLLLVGFVGLIVAIVRAGQQRAAMCIALGVFLIGASAAMLLGLVVFGNTRNDRYLPLLFLPPLLVSPGFLLLVVGRVIRGSRGELLRAAAYGLVAAIAVAVWILVRGPRDWLLAPYGFDVVLLILIVGAALAMRRPQAHG